MTRQFILPDLGEGLYEAEITEIMVSEGDEIKEGDQIMIVETDKASVEIPSPFTGVLSDIHVKPGDIVEVGDSLMTFDGEAAKQDQPEKQAKTIETGKLQKEEKPKSQMDTVKTTEPVKRNGPVPAAPSTRRLARELGIDIQVISGSGPGGRVTEQDVRSFAQEGPEAKPEAPGKLASQKVGKTGSELPSLISAEDIALPNFSSWGETERTPLRSIRRAVAKKMTASWSQIPHVSHADNADITELERLRKRLKEDVKGLTLTVFAIKALVAALKQYPRFNSSLDTETEEIILKRFYNIGIAVDTDRGLIVPVIHNADLKSMTEIAAELAELVDRTRNDQNTLNDIQGGTFTITNAGVLGGTHFNPIINHPQVAILGMARANWQPVVKKDEYGKMEFVPRLLLPLVLTFDHRVLDGGDGARFLNSIISVLENPEKLLVSI
jgi:pyruvate dehydrogenase E2 component (dihydrolipoamide acetyltransferase)